MKLYPIKRYIMKQCHGVDYKILGDDMQNKVSGFRCQVSGMTGFHSNSLFDYFMCGV